MLLSTRNGPWFTSGKDLPYHYRRISFPKPGTLRHPIQPEGTACIMNTIMDNTGVYRSMKFNTSDLCTGKLTLHPDIVDMVVFDQAESGPHTSTDTGLFAMDISLLRTICEPIFSLIPAVPDRIESHFDICREPSMLVSFSQTL